MCQHIIRWLFAILITSAGTGICADVPYVFGEDGGRPLDDPSLYLVDGVSDETVIYVSPVEPTSIPLSSDSDDSEVPLVSDYDDSDTIVFTTASGPDDDTTETKSRTVGAIKNELNEKVDINNDITRNTAVVIAAKYPGRYNIDQITSIHKYLQSGWHYVNDPRGVDYYSSASNTLLLGKELGCVGAGDCDDFAILMSALTESIGGTTRIILAYNDTSGHAYTEVYLGQVDKKNDHVEDIINWLKSESNTDKIYTHLDPKTKDVWLNLDWSADHPGGPFWKAEKHRPLLIREKYNKVAPRLPEGFMAGTPGGSTQTGTIQGRVTDEHGSPLIASIVLTDEYGKTHLAVTDRNGNYELSLVPGRYDLTAEKTGYFFEKISANVRTGRVTAIPIHGEEEYSIGTGITLGEPYSWGNDESLVDYYK